MGDTVNLEREAGGTRRGTVHRAPTVGSRAPGKVVLTLAALLLLVGPSCASSKSAEMTVAGSNSMHTFVELLAEDYMALHPEAKINVQAGGSSAGIQAAIAGAAAIGMSSRALKGEEKQLYAIPIALDALAIIVHPNNPTENLSLDQVRGIFSGRVKDWSEIGPYKGAIHIVTREEGSGTRGAFEELVMKKDFISPKALVQDASGAVRQLVAQDARSVGYISLGLIDKTVKAVGIDGVVAGEESVAAGSYALLRPFLFVTRKEPEGEVKDFIDFVVGPQGQSILASEGLLPQKAAKGG
ncbi:MAG: phosphate ABC transporter substrate-binding protein [Chloroflexi bacterium]|nr:phosphate ABC transporter substrate-binding protein [Chloroflexota bacterium]